MNNELCNTIFFGKGTLWCRRRISLCFWFPSRFRERCSKHLDGTKNAERFQRPPVVRVRAAVLSVLHKLKSSQMSHGINARFNPSLALIKSAAQSRSVLISNKWFCDNLSVLPPPKKCFNLFYSQHEPRSKAGLVRQLLDCICILYVEILDWHYSSYL